MKIDWRHDDRACHDYRTRTRTTSGTCTKHKSSTTSNIALSSPCAAPPKAIGSSEVTDCFGFLPVDELLDHLLHDGNSCSTTSKNDIMYVTCADAAVTEAVRHGIFGTLGNNPHSALQTLPPTTKERKNECVEQRFDLDGRQSVEEDQVHLANPPLKPFSLFYRMKSCIQQSTILLSTFSPPK